jgi:hypothetical protein
LQLLVQVLQDFLNDGSGQLTGFGMHVLAPALPAVQYLRQPRLPSLSTTLQDLQLFFWR